jgi:hypothetical protein
MPRFSVPARIGTVAVTGAVCLGVATSAVANAQTARITPKSAGCPTQSKISKAAGVSLAKPKVKKGGVTTCTYVNTTKGIAVVVEPTLEGSVTTSQFNKEMKQAAHQYGNAKIHTITKAGKIAAYFEMPKKNDVLGRREYFGAVDASKHLIGLGDNQSPAAITKIARAIG